MGSDGAISDVFIIFNSYGININVFGFKIIALWILISNSYPT